MKRILIASTLSLFVLCATNQPDFAQTSAPPPAVNATAVTTEKVIAANDGDNKTIGALLFEVRLLRIALQTVNTNSKRIQLLAERIRLQQDRVDKVVKDIDETREKINSVATQLTKLAEIEKEFEVQRRQEPMALRRAELDRQLRISQLEVAPLRQRENQLKEREALLLNLNGAEMAKLYDLQQKMEALDREFEDEAAAERKANRTPKR